MAEGGAHPVLLIGVDGIESTLLQQGADEGWLPTIHGMLRDGASVLLSPDPVPFPNAAWPTTITGVDAWEHLLLLDRQLRPGTYKKESVGPDASRRPPFWRFASDAGVRSTVVSVKGSPLLRPFLGTQILGGSVGDSFLADVPPLGDPPAALRMVLREAPRRKVRIPFSHLRTPRMIRGMGNELTRSVREQQRLLALLMERTSWDFCFGLFSEAHVGGHLLWRVEDEQGPGGDARAALRDVYSALDRAIALSLEHAPADSVVALVTPQGMGPAPLTGDPTRQILERAGLLALRSGREGPADPGPGNWQGRLAHLARGVARGVLPVGFRRGMWQRFAPKPWIAAMSEADASRLESEVDWSATRAFPLPSDFVSNIRINLAGREPAGIVPAGEPYATLCREIALLFQSMVDDETGRPAVSQVVIAHEMIGEVPRDVLPDVYVQWDASGPTRRLRSPELGAVDLPVTDPRTGEHRQPGFLIARGPGIEPSGLASLGGSSASVLDVAPTILALLGVPQPPGLRGRPIPLLPA
jgi:predicted AlkP superfamily phosphohydrolase/phosphomutase